MTLTWPTFILLIVGILLALTAVAAFYWAAKNGQFRNMEQGSKEIFDEEEPIGQPTDMVFKKKKNSEKKTSS